MTLDEITRFGIDPAFRLLPVTMDKREARLMQLAIGLQESIFIDRRQMVGKPPQPVGPAKSFWQGEQGGGMVAGVRTHAATRQHALVLYKARGVADNNSAIWNAIENDDVLAAGLARLLLYSDPYALPELGNVAGAWQLYLRTWRPGAYERGNAQQRQELREKWNKNYAQALSWLTKS